MASFLHNDKIRLRAPELSDLSKIVEWENDSSLWSDSSTLAPFSHRQLWNYIENYSGDIFAEKQLRLIIEDRNLSTVVGIADLYDFDCKNNLCKVGILVDEKFRHNNIGFEALSLLEEYAFNFLSINHLFAIVAEDNINSIKLFEKLKYKKIAVIPQRLKRNNGYISAFLYSKIANHDYPRR